MKFCFAKYDEIIYKVDVIFQKKSRDYGSAWRIMRPVSILDQLFIKANRIKTIQDTGEQRVHGTGDDISSEFLGIVNYSVIGQIQLTKGHAERCDLGTDEATHLYEKSLYLAQKNIDDALSEMSPRFEIINLAELNDLILKKINLLKRAIEDDYLLSQIDPIKEMMKISNYGIFASMILEGEKV